MFFHPRSLPTSPGRKTRDFSAHQRKPLDWSANSFSYWRLVGLMGNKRADFWRPGNHMSVDLDCVHRFLSHQTNQSENVPPTTCPNEPSCASLSAFCVISWGQKSRSDRPFSSVKHGDLNSRRSSSRVVEPWFFEQWATWIFWKKIWWVWLRSIDVFHPRLGWKQGNFALVQL